MALAFGADDPIISIFLGVLFVVFGAIVQFSTNKRLITSNQNNLHNTTVQSVDNTEILNADENRNTQLS